MEGGGVLLLPGATHRHALWVHHAAALQLLQGGLWVGVGGTVSCAALACFVGGAPRVACLPVTVLEAAGEDAGVGGWGARR
jgi:hypothetical protein